MIQFHHISLPLCVCPFGPEMVLCVQVKCHVDSGWSRCLRGSRVRVGVLGMLAWVTVCESDAAFKAALWNLGWGWTAGLHISAGFSLTGHKRMLGEACQLTPHWPKSQCCP